MHHPPWSITEGKTPLRAPIVRILGAPPRRAAVGFGLCGPCKTSYQPGHLFCANTTQSDSNLIERILNFRDFKLFERKFEWAINYIESIIIVTTVDTLS